ncbi:MAG: thioredoxin family protein [Pontiellaceae bacterium]|nr:thioredoxin family protein [Pontiellaceae bacterium]MBN2784964.1 thioredoxin family protein [Pontiellaceae bacterium]
MKKYHIAYAAMLSLLGTALTAPAIELGESLVDTEVSMQNIDGSMVTIDSAKGEKGTLVIFTCNHCPFVMAWQKEMAQIGNEYLKKGVGVIFINSNDPAAKGDSFEGMQALAKAEGYTFPYAVDATSEIAKHYGAAKTPDVFLFDAAGKLAYKGAVSEGGRAPKEGGEPYLKNALDALLADKPIPTPTTKAVGCSIKFR